MTEQIKTAIKAAEKSLEEDRQAKLRNDVYQYLKQEHEAIDSIEQKVQKLSEERRAHEENIKNIKQGNLKAIEERRKTYDWVVYTPRLGLANTTSIGTYANSVTNATAFYSNVVAGATVTTTAGNTYIY